MRDKKIRGDQRDSHGVAQRLLMSGSALVCLLLLGGCADKPTYEADYDQGFPFSQLKTYRGYDDDYNTRESQYRRRNSMISGCAIQQIRS